MKKNIFKKLFIKFSKLLGFEIIDQSEFSSPTLNKELNENSLENYLETKSFPDPDLIIRSGGEKRLSNFYLWQSAYSELFFSDKLWPDFNVKDFDIALEDFKSRKRKFGVETG